MTTTEKISVLRQKMQEKGISAFVVYSADPHMSEYLPEEWQGENMALVLQVRQVFW